MEIQIREGTRADLSVLQQLYYHTIRTVNRRDYSPPQIEMWSSFAWDEAGWLERLATQRFFVALMEQTVVGFASLEADGHIDLFFIHADYQGQRIGSRLMADLEAIVRQVNCPRMYAEVSVTARPFFQRQGFSIVEEQRVERQGIEFQRYLMEKPLPV
jgi:putative acetyltransferase